MKGFKGHKPLKETTSPSPYSGAIIKGSFRGAKPLFLINLPLPLIKGKGDKGG